MSLQPPPTGDGAAERITRAQELSEERVRNGQLQVKVAALESQLSAQSQRRERANTVRFVTLCTVILLGLAALVYLQVDSQGSGRLRGALVRQCEQRNANLEILKASFAQQADVYATQGDRDNERIVRSLSTAFQTVNCAELR